MSAFELSVRFFLQLTVILFVCRGVNPHFPALRSGPMAVSGAPTKSKFLAATLDFLEAGKVYNALICTDAPAAEGQPARVQVERRQVKRGDRLSGAAFASGGYAVRLTPRDSLKVEAEAR